MLSGYNRCRATSMPLMFAFGEFPLWNPNRSAVRVGLPGIGTGFVPRFVVDCRRPDALVRP